MIAVDYGGRVDAEKILNSQWCEGLIRAETEKVAARARGFAPVDSGELRGSIGTRVDRNSGSKRDRLVGVVFTNATAKDGSAYGAAGEFGTSESRGHYFLRRAL